MSLFNNYFIKTEVRPTCEPTNEHLRTCEIYNTQNQSIPSVKPLMAKSKMGYICLAEYLGGKRGIPVTERYKRLATRNDN